MLTPPLRELEQCVDCGFDIEDCECRAIVDLDHLEDEEGIDEEED